MLRSSEIIFVVILDKAVAALLRLLGWVEVWVDWLSIRLDLRDRGRVCAFGKWVRAAAFEKGRLLCSWGLLKGLWKRLLLIFRWLSCLWSSTLSWLISHGLSRGEPLSFLTANLSLLLRIWRLRNLGGGLHSFLRWVTVWTVNLLIMCRLVHSIGESWIVN